ncbi:MAG: hypothetical protein J1F60_01180 [Oscillospiraceae bacterium]|nr:hypothetical protein [Oscillospiraceae bacterium]
MADKEKDVIKLIGDFYQARVKNDEETRKETLEKLEHLVYTGDIEGSAFVKYYNDVLSGRHGFNAKLNLEDYPKESIIRELFQNAFGCLYATPDIKVVVDFQEDDTVIISYNEVGFTMEDVLYYFGFGIGSGDATREGRFGIGAKSVFLNVEYIAVRSNNYGFKIVNENKSVSITEFDLGGKMFKGTRITLKLAHEEYERIKDNFLTLTEKKGDYINIVELCFAFNRKKVMNREQGDDENPDRTFNIAVSQNGQVTDVYRIALNRKSEEDTPKIRFFHNNKSLVDFLYYENEGFVYLVPYAVANTKRKFIIQLLLEKYNYFSTYELTGYIANGKEKIVDDKLSAFFVSVPNTVITNTRTGIRFDKEVVVYDALERDIPEILKINKDCFILDLKQTSGGESYTFSPRSYAFEFFNSFLKTSRFAEKVREAFINGISIMFPNEKEPTPYGNIRKNGVKSTIRGVSKGRHEDGSALEEYVTLRLQSLKERLPQQNETAVYAGYEWASGNTEEKGRVYRYEVSHGGSVYTIDSAESGTQDYELYSGFPSLVDCFLPGLLTEDCVTDEDNLEQIFSLFDEAAGADYALSMKYYRIHFDRDGENNSFEISRIKINNVKNAMDTLEKRSKHFVNNQNYLEVVSLVMNSFTEGKDTMTFLREIKQQGGVISLTLDFNKRFRLAAYGRQFMIPSTVTNTDLVEILGDFSQLLESGLLKGRKFDFPYSPSRYAFDQDEVAHLLLSYASVQETKAIMNSTMTVNLKYDGVAFLTEEDKVVCIKHFGEPVSVDERSNTKRYIILRDDLSKMEFASMLEYVIAGSDLGILNRFFTRAKAPNRIIPDQVPLKYRRAPVLSHGEFEFAQELYESIKGDSELANYKSYFAKDINSRLYGYGTYCSSCGENGHDINAYDLADFSVDIMIEGVEKHFSFAMYLCRNHISNSDGWLVKELTIGGMDPFTWMAELNDAQDIPPEFFIGSMKYVPHLVYDITPDGEPSTDVVISDPETLHFRLTPLMAAKWLSDNTQS